MSEATQRLWIGALLCLASVGCTSSSKPPAATQTQPDEQTATRDRDYWPIHGAKLDGVAAASLAAEWDSWFREEPLLTTMGGPTPPSSHLVSLARSKSDYFEGIRVGLRGDFIARHNVSPDEWASGFERRNPLARQAVDEIRQKMKALAVDQYSKITRDLEALHKKVGNSGYIPARGDYLMENRDGWIEDAIKAARLTPAYHQLLQKFTGHAPAAEPAR